MKHKVILRYEPFEYPFEFNSFEEAAVFADMVLEHDVFAGDEHRGGLDIILRKVEKDETGNTEGHACTCR